MLRPRLEDVAGYCDQIRAATRRQKFAGRRNVKKPRLRCGANGPSRICRGAREPLSARKARKRHAERPELGRTPGTSCRPWSRPLASDNCKTAADFIMSRSDL